MYCLVRAVIGFTDNVFLQVKDMPEDNRDSRPVLLAVGLLLAPDDFQVVLDADDPSEGIMLLMSEPFISILYRHWAF